MRKKYELKERVFPEELLYLVPLLTDHAMTKEEIQEENRKRGIRRAIEPTLRLLSTHYCLFDVGPGKVKILTEQDMQDFQKQLRKEHSMQKMKRQKNYKGEIYG